MMEVYINNVKYTKRSINWSTNPRVIPYPLFTETIGQNIFNSLISAIYSIDEGKTFALHTWDYLLATTSGKTNTSSDPPEMPDCWMGAMIHSICGSYRKLDECNGRFRSNVFFSEYPTGETAYRAWRCPRQSGRRTRAQGSYRHLQRNR